MTGTILNLDKITADRAQKMVAKGAEVRGVKKPVETLERLVTKSLGVLQEQGIYAMMLFLFSRSGDEDSISPCIRLQLYDVLRQIPGCENIHLEDEPKNDLRVISECVLKELDTLLLVRDLYEQTLIYARYGAKACSKAAGD